MSKTPAQKRRVPPGFFDEEFLGNSPSPKKHRCNDPRRQNFELGGAYFKIFHPYGCELDTQIHLFELMQGSSPTETIVEAVGGSGGFVDSCCHWETLLSLLGTDSVEMVVHDYKMRVGSNTWSINHPDAWARAIRELMLLFYGNQQPNEFWPAQIGPVVAWKDLRDVQHRPDLYEHWQDTCQFFCHDPVQTGVGVHLPGFREPLSTIAMVKIFWALHALVTKAHLPLPLTMQEEVAKVGVVALCWSSVDQHLAGEHDARCPGSTAGGQAFGVQCPCQTPNLTYDVWLHSVRAPSIFYVAQKTDFIRVMTVLHQLFAKLPPPPISKISCP
ncbi:hypothetical protein BGZ61DRAFT_486087 [Ilyonectria robusta]|uniref:uncharacterized protein n=1 Tax=Ilyonectria robusta TaxID=1079257 RepID=UPI001E8EAF2E|nr:uncharacterized protein BGZ61DRAFT_486087 [Ilyonectria robusta]KAH8658904.1 hypothetical protein BGZ61DRAFT_486087 [Ilyonectria robusta]